VVLAVDDNPVGLTVLRHALERHHLEVHCAASARQALEAAALRRYDLVLMDLQMPEMDGYQATAKLRSDERFASLPIIAMTAHATIEERQRCLVAGMNDHLSKPIDPAMLFETVARFFRPLAVPIHDPTVRETVAEPLVPGPGETAPDGALPAFAGLDTKGGLSRVAGNRKLYLKLLRQFLEQGGPVVAQVTAAMAQGDVRLAERLAHTLKGVAGNIGAKAVQSAAGTLEKIIRAGAPAIELDAAMQQLTAALTPLLGQLRAAVTLPVAEASAPASQPLAADPAQSRQAAAQLLKLLSEFDPAAADFTEVSQRELRPLFAADAWLQFEKLVQGYSFAEAQAQLERLLNQSHPA